ncbi:DUF1997 domain-containing protein [Cyanobium sp. Morenito 9A2]|uniref:DUF1997 domain-containing protein n=1 Tax=Cyanobium sp. Morenito 9A2 TaxID=2823718 RepID=UPI0020CF9B59|nr:DUF1997 domain-containing protein [Cyanobium sp. Morenito 9A2]MCP9850676.1 DUF1997 domain-containing protein [Cyanobium sp. Morenito 9A2]
MNLTFSASQRLVIPVREQAERLDEYLADEQRIIKALFDPVQLSLLGPGRYRYEVTKLQVFQLQIQPVVEMETRKTPGRLDIEATDAQLVGLGMVEEFQLSLSSWLLAKGQALEGEASLSVSVSRPPLLRLIPVSVLTATGGSLLGGLLKGMKIRVSQQLLKDFQQWCLSH